MKSIISLWRTLLLWGVLLLLPAWAAAQHYSTTDKKAIKEYEKGQTALYQGQAATAMKHFRQAWQQDSSFCEAGLMLAEWYQDAGDDSLSLRYYRGVVQANPTFFTPAWLQMGQMELNRNHNRQAQEYFSTFLRLDTKHQDRHETARHGLACATFRIQAMENPVLFTPQNLGSGVNSANDEYFPALTADGNTLIFTRRFPRKSTTTANTQEEEDFYISVRENGRWQPATRMQEPVNSTDNEGAQCIARDGRIMIFTACGRPDGLGRCDLYLCTRHGNQWTAPRNMGAPVNSTAWESQPSLSFDGNTLYFVSDRKGGYGGTDIWMTTLRDGQWSTPVNLGPTINTPGNESSPFIHFDNNTLYFASTGHVGMGGSDIFLSRRQADGSWSEPQNLGYPINTAGDESSLIVSPDGTMAYFSSDQLGGQGRQDLYCFDLPAALRPQGVTYHEPTDSLAELPVGETVALRNIFFETAKWTLLETSKIELDRVAELLRKHPTIHVMLGGHTDNTGNEAANMKLSQQRAQAVYQYLISCGIDASRLAWHGYGQSQPVAPNDTPEGRAANRRTTFTITHK